MELDSPRLSTFDVGADVDLVRKFRDVDFEAILDIIENLSVGFVGHERDSQAFGAESTRASHPVQVGVGVLGHVVVEDDVDSLDVHASAEQVGRHQNALLEILKLLVAREPLFLRHGSMDADGWEVLLDQELRQSDATGNGFHENDNLVELQDVQQFEELAVLLVVLELDVMLAQAM